MAGPKPGSSATNPKAGKYCSSNTLFVSHSFVWFCFYYFFVVYWAGGKKKEVKKETGLGLTNKKDENFGEWYSEVLFLAWFLCSSLQSDFKFVLGKIICTSWVCILIML